MKNETWNLLFSKACKSRQISMHAFVPKATPTPTMGGLSRNHCTPCQVRLNQKCNFSSCWSQSCEALPNGRPAFLLIYERRSLCGTTWRFWLFQLSATCVSTVLRMEIADWHVCSSYATGEMTLFFTSMISSLQAIMKVLSPVSKVISGNALIWRISISQGSFWEWRSKTTTNQSTTRIIII